MKPSLILTYLLPVILLTFGPAQSRKPDEIFPISQFSLKAFPVAHVHKDSIRVVSLIEIPYTSIQFLKKGKTFYADLEVTIVIKGKEKQFQRFIWQEHIEADSYLETVSLNRKRAFSKSLIVPIEPLVIVGEIIDQSVNQSGVQEYELLMHKIQSLPKVYPPIPMVNLPGNWGFGPDKYPLISTIYAERAESLFVFISGYISSPTSQLRVKVTHNESQLWETEYTVNRVEDSFYQLVNLPRDIIKKVNINISAEISDDGKSDESQSPLKIRQKGMSQYISDISSALEQMNYILTQEEKKKLKHVSDEEKEDMFFQFWVARDPTPNTPFNELMDEFFKRVSFANERFSGFQPGWKTDMGMIYILMGPPDEVERYNNPSGRNSYEVWYYHRLNEQFVFVDINGFGDYRLDKPFLGYPSRGW
ncbi:MAG: GWxTD domain-containing protein [Fidelibacterota bacterium]